MTRACVGRNQIAPQITAIVIFAFATACQPSTKQFTGSAVAFSKSASSTDRITFTQGAEEFDAVVQRPAQSCANTWGVLLIGGGMGNDIDWTTPGMLRVNDQTMQLSMSGRPHADAPTLSDALARRGFVVLRWSTIARGDPLADEWPIRATPRTLENLLDQSRSALAALRSIRGVRADRIVLLGHSLGAARAFTVAADDPGVQAVVALSPAYFTTAAAPPNSFTQSTMRIGEEVASERAIPVLAVFGALDQSRAVNVPAARALSIPRLDFVEFDGLGHQLGAIEGERSGPIDPHVVECVVDWVDGLASLRQ